MFIKKIYIYVYIYIDDDDFTVNNFDNNNDY